MLQEKRQQNPPHRGTPNAETLTSLASTSICSGLRPVYANMPIWLVMWDQSCLLPRASRFSLSRVRMRMMRSAMPLTSPSHCLLRAGLLSTSAAMRAPWIGGLLYSGRTRIFSCDSTRFFSSADDVTIEKAPTRSPYRPCWMEG